MRRKQKQSEIFQLNWIRSWTKTLEINIVFFFLASPWEIHRYRKALPAESDTVRNRERESEELRHDANRRGRTKRTASKVLYTRFLFLWLCLSLLVYLYIYIVKSCRGGLGVRTMFYYFCVELLCFILLFFWPTLLFLFLFS